MELLINSLENFNIHKDTVKFETDLEYVISSFEKINNLDYEWPTLKANYSKLRYLNELIDNFYIPNSEKFLKSIELFMVKLDRITKYYLQQINWKNQEDSINKESLKIEEYLLISLNSNDCIEKLKNLLKGYEILVPIILEFNNEKFLDIIDDQYFLKEFSVKRRRL
jgi:hypothetical protein